MRIDGCDLAVHEAGDGPPVLMVQGAGAPGAGWSPQVDALPDHRCVWFDNRGFGASVPNEAPLSIERYARDTLAVADGLGLDRFHLVGHSMGGLIALQAALLAPERPLTLTLMCTFATGAVPTRLTPWIAWIGLRTRIGTRAMRRRAFLEMVSPPGGGDAVALGAVFGRDLADQPPGVMSQLSAMRGVDLTPRLGEVRCPTLVLSAEHDRLAPPWAGQALADGIVGARFVVLDGQSHACTVQDVERVNALLREHLGGIPG